LEAKVGKSRSSDIPIGPSVKGGRNFGKVVFTPSIEEILLTSEETADVRFIVIVVVKKINITNIPILIFLFKLNFIRGSNIVFILKDYSKAYI
jgi:hypothetical protein